MTFLAVVVAGLVLVSALVLGLALAIAAVRGLRARREARRRAVAEPLRPLILEVAVGEGEDAAAAADALTALDAAAWRTVEAAVLLVLGKVRGDGQRLLVELLAVRGVITRERAGLHARSAVRRATAAELLGAAAYAPAVPELAALLHDDDAEVRLVAARALGRAGAPGAVGVLEDDATGRAAQALLAALAGERPAAPPDVVARSLLLLGAPATGALRTALSDPSALVRLTAAEVLGRLGASAAAGDLEDLVLRDGSDAVRARAATALGRLGAPTSASALRAATSPSSAASVRRAAAVALGEVGDPTALRCLWGLLDDRDAHLASAAAAALLALGAPGARVLAQVAGQSAGGSPQAVARAHEVLVCAELAEVLPAASAAEVGSVRADAAARDAAAAAPAGAGALVGAGA